MSYVVISYYRLFPPGSPEESPEKEISLQREFLEALDCKARIYISEQGINGQLSLPQKDACTYVDWMHSRQAFRDLAFKAQMHHEHAFPRLIIKHRKQLVAFDCVVDLKERAEHVSPARWKEMLESESPPLLLDIRNDYEWEVGHFAGAERPPCKQFRDFPDYAEEVASRVSPDQPVMMSCTGGIRCEFFSALLRSKGVKNLYQLEGGVLGYAREFGSAHFEGKLFVFDDRMTVPLDDQPSPPLSYCHHCEVAVDDYYNCAAMDCNTLFLSCRDCIEQKKGCCSDLCAEKNHLRPWQEQNPHKPFRRKHLLTTQ